MQRVATGLQHTFREPKHFANRPTLERASTPRNARGPGRDLGDVAGRAPLEVTEQRHEEARRRLDPILRRVAPDTEPRLDERTRQPRPHGALVVGAVPLPHVAAIVADVAGFPGA